MNLDVGEWDDNGAASSSFKWTADAKVAPAAPAPAPVEEKPQDEGAKGAGKRKELDPEVVARKKAKRKQQAARQKAKAKEVKERDHAPMNKEQYLKFQRARMEVVEFDGATA